MTLKSKEISILVQDWKDKFSSRINNKISKIKLSNDTEFDFLSNDILNSPLTNIANSNIMCCLQIFQMVCR